MHEQSLVRSLLKQVEQLRIQNDAVTVDAITVEVGPLSGVEPELIQDAYAQLVGSYFPSNPHLEVQTINLQIRCRNCQKESAVEKITLQCPVCLSTSVQVIRGDEFRLIDVSMQVPLITHESRK